MKAVLIAVIIVVGFGVAYLFLKEVQNQAEFVTLQREIDSLKAVKNRNATLIDFRDKVLVVGGIQIQSSKGKIVADFRSIGEEGQIQLHSFSESSVENGMAMLTADGRETSLLLSRGKAPDATEGDLWSSYGADGFYIQRGIGMDMKAPKEWASIKVGEYGAIQQVGVIGRGMEVAAAYTAEKKDVGEYPVSLGLFGTKEDGSKGGPSVTLTNNRGLGISNDGLPVVNLVNLDGTGSLALYKGGLLTHLTEGGDNSPDSQKVAFQQAVASEANGSSLPNIQGQISAYMNVVAQDPTSDFGKAASVRVSQLEARRKEMEHLIFSH